MKYCLALIVMMSGAGWAQVCAPLGALGLNSQITASLDSSNCTLADGTWFVDYLLQVPSQGTWSGSVIPADGGTAPLSLVLRDQAGTRIDSGPKLQRAVERGTYHLLVNAVSPLQGGSYSLTTNFQSTPDILCHHLAMVGTLRPVDSSLGLGSCKLPDGSPFESYNLTLYGMGTVDVAAHSTGFTPLVILRTADGRAVASNDVADDSGVVHLVVPGVGSDTYTVVIAAPPGETGVQTHALYTMAANFTPDADESCVAAARLAATQLYSGDIANGTCNFTLPGREDPALFNYFNIHVESVGVIQVSLDAVDFSSHLLLLDADGNAVVDDIQSGDSGTPLIRAQVRPGDYRLIVLNEDSFGGGYTLNYQFAPGPAAACALVPMESGAQVTGILSGSNSCRDNGFLADVFTLVMPSDGTINLSLFSPDFSTFLNLHDANDNELLWATQEAGGLASSINVDLPAGTYYVHAASTDRPGAYVLAYTFNAKTLGACPSPQQMPPNGFIHNAQLGAASCVEPDGRRADYYRFPLANPTTEGVFLTSNSFLPDLTLYRADGTPLRSDQTSYAGNNAMIVQYLAAGDYLVRARAAEPSFTGSYSLDLLQSQGGLPQMCRPRPIGVYDSISGQTSFTSCVWYDKTFADVYQLTVSGSAQLLAVNAVSSYFDTFLILMDGKGNVLSSDDNTAGGTSALVVQSLEPGDYYLIVKPADAPTSAGNYVLTTSPAP